MVGSEPTTKFVATSTDELSCKRRKRHSVDQVPPYLSRPHRWRVIVAPTSRPASGSRDRLGEARPVRRANHRCARKIKHGRDAAPRGRCRRTASRHSTSSLEMRRSACRRTMSLSAPVSTRGRDLGGVFRKRPRRAGAAGQSGQRQRPLTRGGSAFVPVTFR